MKKETSKKTSTSSLTPEQIKDSWENLKNKRKISLSKTLSVDELKLSNLDAFNPKSLTQELKDEKLEEMFECGFIEQFEVLLKSGAKMELGKIVVECIQTPSKWAFAKLGHEYGLQYSMDSIQKVWKMVIDETMIHHVGMTLERLYELKLPLPVKVIEEVWKNKEITELHCFLNTPYSFFPKVWTPQYQRILDKKLNQFLTNLNDNGLSFKDMKKILDDLIQTTQAMERSIQKDHNLKGLNVFKNFQGTKKAKDFFRNWLNVKIKEPEMKVPLFCRLLQVGIYPPERGVSDSFEGEKSWPWLVAEKGFQELFYFLMQDETQKKLCEEDCKNFKIPSQYLNVDEFFFRLTLPYMLDSKIDLLKDDNIKIYVTHFLDSFTYGHELDKEFSLEEEKALLKLAPFILEHSILNLNASNFLIPLPSYGALNIEAFKSVLEKEILKEKIPERNQKNPKMRI